MNIYQNLHSAHLMLWEPSPRKRNINNSVNLCMPVKSELNPGDLVIGEYGADGISVYEITEVKGIRPASVSKMNYVETVTDWKKKPISFFRGQNLENCSLGFQKLING